MARELAPGEPTNEERAERAYRTLLQGQYMAGSSEEVEEGITDLMSDLLHLADQYDVDETVLLERIARHHRDEREACG